MKIVIPMAGMGTRMRPHTLTIPKPLIKVAGKPIVQRLVEDIAKVCSDNIEEVAFIIGNFGAAVEKQLISIAESIGAKGTIHYQLEALGTAHAVYCAESVLSGNVIVAFADTLFVADFKLDKKQDGIIWVHKVDNPSSFGVVKTDNEGIITDFIEKPQEFISDKAIIGIYYFRQGEDLRTQIKYLLDNNINVKGEFQLTDALENMKKGGAKLKVGAVNEWLDCGNKDATVLTNARVLNKIGQQISRKAKITNSVVVEPCFISDGAIIENSVVGPNVSIGVNTVLSSSVVSNSIIQDNTKISDSVISNSMIGNFAACKGKKAELSISDYSVCI
jgi:glucose-1-phosphate thymidylyltransferase